MAVEFTNNSVKILSQCRSTALTAMTRCGQKAQGYAQDLALVDTGALRNTIAFKVEQASSDVYKMSVGTNSEYGAHQELGTGRYYTGGRQTPWVYQDSHGNWHYTHGNPANPFIEPAIANYTGTYKNIITDQFRSG